MEEGVRGTESFFIISLNVALSLHRNLATAEISMRAAVLNENDTTSPKQDGTSRDNNMQSKSERTQIGLDANQIFFLFHRPVSDWRPRILCGGSTDFDNNNNNNNNAGGSMVAKVRWGTKLPSNSCGQPLCATPTQSW